MSNSYIGKELTLFKDAVNWKKYWLHSIKDYLSGRLLEVGAGIGGNTLLFVSSSKTIQSIDAIEPDIDLSKELARAVKNPSIPVNIRNSYLKDIPTTEKFDTILYIDVLEHIEDDKKELAIAANYLNQKGHLIVLSPAYNFLFSKFDKAIGHHRRYTKASLSKLTAPSLNQVSFFYLDSIGVMSSLANKLILRQDYPSSNQILFWDRTIVPLSRFFDRIFFRSFGRSVISIWQKQ